MPWIEKLSVRTTSTAIIGLSVLLAICLLTQQTAWQWGLVHAPHEAGKPQPLSVKTGYEQTIIAEHDTISGLLLQFEPVTRTADIVEIRLHAPDQPEQVVGVSVTNILPGGYLLVPFKEQWVGAGQMIRLTVTSSAKVPLALKYQIDSTKYPQGELKRIYHTSGEKKSIQGDLAFAVRYRVSAWDQLPGPRSLYSVGGLLLVLAWWFVVWPLLHQRLPAKWSRVWSRPDWWAIGFLVFLVLLVFWPWVRHVGDWPVNTDFSKDILYVHSAAQAIKQAEIPAWHHVMCGGQPLLGNVEAGTFSLLPLLALLLPAAVTVSAWLIIELMLGAVGAYILARVLHISPLAALWPAIIYILQGFVVHRLYLGHTMYIGGLALAPWVVLAFQVSTKRPRWLWAAAAGLALMLGRGDTHILFYTVLLLAVWGAVTAILQRTWKPIVVLGAIVALLLPMTAVKVLPVLEGRQHYVGSKLPKHVVTLTSARLFDDFLINRRQDVDRVDVRHGEIEEWENIGGFVGFASLIAAAVGFYFAPRGLRWLLGIGGLTFLMISEGTLYDSVLQYLPIAGELMRLPSRAVWVLAFLLGIAGGLGCQKILLKWPRAGKGLVALLLVIVSVELGSYTWQKLEQIEWVEATALPAASYPQQRALADSHQSDQHYVAYAEAGYVLRNSCPDFHSRTHFPLDKDIPLVQASDPRNATLTTTVIQPNEIVIEAPPNVRAVSVQSVPSRLLSVDNGIPLLQEDGLHILRLDSAAPVRLSYHSLTFPAGAVLAFGVSFALLYVTMFVRGETTTKAA